MNHKETCAICEKELNPWFTSLKKYKGEKVCSKCATKMIKDDFRREQENKKPKQISEVKATCLACGNTWYYGKNEQLESLSNSFSNLGKSMMCCSGCTPAVFIPDKKIIDLNKCPKCGSKAIQKENVIHNIK